MIVLAIDPGPRWTALVVRDTHPPANDDDALVAHELLDRDKYRAHVSGIPAAPDRLTEWSRYCTLSAYRLWFEHVPEIVAVEAAVAPTPYGAGGNRPRVIDPGPIIETAFVAGALCERLSAVLIPPAGFGAPVPNRRVLEAMYPPSLIGPRETTGAGKSPRQHLRAAFDLAAAAASPIHRRPS